jgi:hypothetical protein
MTRRSDLHKRKPSRLPLILGAFGSILLLTAVFLFARQGSAGNDGSGAPKIVVDQQKIDYGYVKFGNNESFTVKVTNTGDGVLRFKEKPYIEVLEGC